MSEHETSDQIKLMKRDLQRMRLAIIIIVAFFIYEAIGPLPFASERVKLQEKIKVRELLVVDERGETIAYLGSDSNGAGLILNDDLGNRLDLRASIIKLMAPGDVNHIDRMHIQVERISTYDENGYVTGIFPHD